MPEFKRSPKLEEFLDGAAESLFGRDRKESFENNKCISCGGPATEFRDELSKKEYQLSYFCQKCQDEVFSGDDIE
jgi:hypothetical protein